MSHVSCGLLERFLSTPSLCKAVGVTIGMAISVRGSLGRHDSGVLVVMCSEDIGKNHNGSDKRLYLDTQDKQTIFHLLTGKIKQKRESRAVFVLFTRIDDDVLLSLWIRLKCR